MATTSVTAAGRPREALFTRQASGLVRELGIPAAVGISLASVALVNTFINFNAGLTSFQMSDMIIPLLIGAVIWLIGMFAYRYLLQAVPRAGGEYVYASRIISPAAGAMIGISIAIIFMYTLAANANFAASYVPFMLTSLGLAFHSSALTSAAGNVSSQGAVAIIDVVMLLVVAAASIASLRRVAQVILALVILQVIAFFVLGGILLANSHAAFVSAFGSFSGHSDAYNQVMAAASKAKLPIGFSLGASLLVVPFMVLNYNGVLYSYYVGGELKRPGRTYLWASVVSIGVLLVVWLGIWLLLRGTVGLDFMQAQAALGSSDPTAYGKITSLPSAAGGLGYGLVLSGDPVTKILIGTSIPFTEVAVDMAFVAVVTRVLFALAFDRLLPVSIAKISERNAAPVNAIIIAVIGGIFFALLATFVNLANIVANISLFFALILLVGSVCAMVLPYRRPELIRKPGSDDVERWGGVPVATLFGGAATILALITVFLIIANPQVFGQFSVTSVGALVIVFGAGPIVYAIARQLRLRSSSIDLRVAMRELPPE